MIWVSAISALVICISPVNSLTRIESHCNLFPTLRTISAARAFMGALITRSVTAFCSKWESLHVNNLECTAVNGRSDSSIQVGGGGSVLIQDTQDSQHSHIGFTLWEGVNEGQRGRSTCSRHRWELFSAEMSAAVVRKGIKKSYRKPTYFRSNRRQSGRLWIGSCSNLYNSGKSQHSKVPTTFAAHRERSSGQRVQLSHLDQPFSCTGRNNRRRRHSNLFISLGRHLVCQLLSGKGRLTSFSSLSVPIGSMYLFPN